MRVKPKTLTRARALRRQMSLPEVLMWRELRRQRFSGFRFRRQAPQDPYIADFLCLLPRVVIEIDGATHDGAAAVERDAARDTWFIGQGFAVYRIPAGAILNDLNSVLEGLAIYLEGLKVA